jgi:hypothetical protein
MNLEESAMDDLRNARRAGSLAAMDRAQHSLDGATRDAVAEQWHARVFELAEALFQSIRMQLSVEKYKAISTDRGATLDTLDVPLNSRLWLEQRFDEVRKLSGESDRLGALDQIVNWTNPGPGGFYDDLGNLTNQPHLIRGPGPSKDPAFLDSSLVGFGSRGTNRVSWWTHAESLNDAPLRMEYRDLDPNAEYKVRVVYAGDSPRQKIRLTANGTEVHALMQKPVPVKPLEFDIPKSATQGGDLTLEWTREPGQGGNGRGCQVAEVWLVKKAGVGSREAVRR